MRIFMNDSRWQTCIQMFAPPPPLSQGHIVNVSIAELLEVWKRTFNRQQRVQNSQAAAVTALSRLIRSEVRFQPTLPSLHLPRTHSVQRTLAPDRFSGTNLSSMPHRHYHTPPTHCTVTLYSMCVHLEERGNTKQTCKNKHGRTK